MLTWFNFNPSMDIMPNKVWGEILNFNNATIEV